MMKASKDRGVGGRGGKGRSAEKRKKKITTRVVRRTDPETGIPYTTLVNVSLPRTLRTKITGDVFSMDPKGSSRAIDIFLKMDRIVRRRKQRCCDRPSPIPRLIEDFPPELEDEEAPDPPDRFDSALRAILEVIDDEDASPTPLRTEQGVNNGDDDDILDEAVTTCLDPSEAAIFSIVSTSPIPSAHREPGLSKHILAKVFAFLDPTNEGVVPALHVRRILEDRSMAVTKYREWLLMPPRSMKIDDSLFAHLWKYCNAHGRLYYFAFVDAMAALNHGPADLTFTSQISRRAWARPDMSHALFRQLQSPYSIFGQFILSSQHVRFGKQLGTVFMMPRTVLAMCNHIVHDPRCEFYKPFNAEDHILIGLRLFESLLLGGSDRVDGVFAISTFCADDVQVARGDVEALSRLPKTIQASTIRYFGTYENENTPRGEKWAGRILRVERLRPIVHVTPFEGLTTLVEVEVSSADKKCFVVSRDIVGEGDVVAPPLTLEASMEGWDSSDSKHASSMLSSILPAENRTVRVPEGLLQKVAFDPSPARVPTAETTASLISRHISRYLPRRNGHRVVA